MMLACKGYMLPPVAPEGPVERPSRPSQTPLPPSCRLLELPLDVMLYALEFLDPRCVATMGACSTTMRALATEPQLWLPKCLKAWGLPPSTPARAVLDSLLSNGHSLHCVYPRIPATWPEELEVRERPAGSPNPFQLAARDPHTVRLISNHGQNRAIRSTRPFPDLPKPRDELDEDSMWNRLICLFRCKAPRLPLATMPALPEVMGFPRPLAQIEEADVASEPFSMPWRRTDASIDLAPRLVAYYEVTICECEGLEEEYSGCVAVGLGLQEFPLEGFMPGWDSTSFAYHSDDGGIFHGTGIKVRYYGPRFGPGDVVGCGLDYARHQVFFTLNGRYLGVAFEGVQGRFYPTVGIDALNPLTLNFGDHPFAFDLAGYLEDKIQLDDEAARRADMHVPQALHDMEEEE